MGENDWYRVTWNGQLVGFTQFQIEREVEFAGDRFYVINSRYRLKVGWGSIGDERFVCKTLLTATDLRPSYYMSSGASTRTRAASRCCSPRA